MGLVQITSVTSADRPDPAIRAFRLDAPVEAAELWVDAVEIDGWVLGDREPISAVRVDAGSVTSRTVSVAVERPDVAAAYPGAPVRCGFRAAIPLSTADEGFVLDLAAVLDDGRTAPLARIAGHRLLWTNRSGSSEPGEFTPAHDVPAIELDVPVAGGAVAVGSAIEGWAVSRAGIAGVSIWLDDALVGWAACGLPRADLAAAMPDIAKAGRAGFRFVVDRPLAEPRSARLTVVAEDGLGRRAGVAREVQISETASRMPPPAGSLDLPLARSADDPLAGAGWSGPVVVHGWAADGLGIEGVDVLVDGAVVAAAELGLPREDVDILQPEWRRLGMALRSGWLTVLDSGDFSPGDHVIGAVMRGRSGTVPLGETRVRFRERDGVAGERRRQTVAGLLRCPTCGGGFGPDGANRLRCVGCERAVVANEHGTWLVDETYAGIDWRRAVATSHSYPPGAREVIAACRDGLVLEVGGGLHERLPNVVQLDAIPFPTTDVAADGRAMPFADETFDGVIACALLEHVASPSEVVAEMRRVCKLGGQIYADCTTVHPYHGFPHHYFNATETGLAWLMDECGGAAGTIEPGDARTGVGLVLDGWLGSLADDAARAHARDLPVGDLVRLLLDPASDQARFDALGAQSAAGSRLVPPKVMFRGVRVR